MEDTIKVIEIIICLEVFTIDRLDIYYGWDREATMSFVRQRITARVEE